MRNNNPSEERKPRDYVSVEVRNVDEQLASSILTKMETVAPSCCICRVQENLRKENQKAYDPERVSIGPLHRTKESLQAMEEQKWRYLRALLSRKPTIDSSLDNCVKAVRELEHRARKCYQDPINLSSDEFVEMILLDGCFIIELFFRFAVKGLRRKGDPVFSNHWILISSLRSDLILLENQLPFFLLLRLFDLVPIPKQCNLPFTDLAFRFFKVIIPGDNREALQSRFINMEGNHFLDLIRNCFLPTHPKKIHQESQVKIIRKFDCTTKLQEQGIRFKKVAGESLLDVRFVNGVLEIPTLKVHLYTDSLLRNLIALEKCCCNESSATFVASYAFLMESLVDSSMDVKVLHQKRILINCSENEEESLPDLFKKLCKEIVVEDFYYEGIWEQVNEYVRSNTQSWWPRLKRSYFRSKDGILFFIVVAFLMFFTFTGTLFFVLSFFLQHF